MQTAAFAIIEAFHLTRFADRISSTTISTATAAMAIRLEVAASPDSSSPVSSVSASVWAVSVSAATASVSVCAASAAGSTAAVSPSANANTHAHISTIANRTQISFFISFFLPVLLRQKETRMSTRTCGKQISSSNAMILKSDVRFPTVGLSTSGSKGPNVCTLISANRRPQR